MGKAPLKEILAALTPEEKTRLVVGRGFYPAGSPRGILPARDLKDRKVTEKLPGAAGRTPAIARHSVAHARRRSGRCAHRPYLRPGQPQNLLRHGFSGGRAADLASFNTAAEAWVADAGTYQLKVGASAPDTQPTAPSPCRKA